MASAHPYWDQHYDHDPMSKLFFAVGSESMDHSLRTYHQGSLTVGFERRITPPCSSPKTLSSSQLLFCPPVGDQVVPSLQKLSVFEHTPPCSPRRSIKPLPPLPDLGDLSSDEAEDNEVEFFSCTSENQCLVPSRCSKASSFQYGMPGRRSCRASGRVNFAYFEGQQKGCGKAPWEQNVTQPPLRLLRSFSGPAGSFKGPSAWHSGLHYNHQQDKPEVPPRVPICPRPSDVTDWRQSSSKEFDSEKPPKIPPRDPIPPLTQHAVSPKRVPIYVNGVMPPTQSFAPYPEYVSKAQHRPSCESSTCILPIMEDGKKVSSTHYFLLPHRPGYLEKFERFFKDSDPQATSHSSYKPKWNS